MTSLDILTRLAEPETFADPYPFYSWLRDNAPVHRNPTGDIYILSRNADALWAYHTPLLRKLEAEEASAKFPRWHKSRLLRTVSRNLAATNPPEHTRLRRVVSRYFTLRQAQHLQSLAESNCRIFVKVVAAKLDDGETVDLHGEFTEPFAIATVSDVIGVPESDRQDLAATVHQAIVSLNPVADDAALKLGDGAAEQVEEYFTALIAERQRNPKEDLISVLMTQLRPEHELGAGLSETELMLMLWGFWLGGFETTASAMDHGVLAMLDHPEMAGWLSGTPAQTAAFVAEVLRHTPPVMVESMPRMAIEDIKLGDFTIPAGADVRMLHGAANRDPNAFPEPDRFDPSRNTSAMITFGHGVHHCLGANLARMECSVALSQLHNALPRIVLAGHPRIQPKLSVRTFETLPIKLSD